MRRFILWVIVLVVVVGMIGLALSTVDENASKQELETKPVQSYDLSLFFLTMHGIDFLGYSDSGNQAWRSLTLDEDSVYVNADDRFLYV